MSALTVATRFTAVDMMSPTVRAMAGTVNNMTQTMNAGLARQERLFRRLTPNIGAAAKQLMSFATAGALFAGVAFSGKAIMDYETSIQSLSAVTGVGGAQLELFKRDIKGLATDTKKSATDVAGSFEVIGSAMSQYLQDPKALHQISDAGITLAKASRQQLVPTLEDLTSIMNQFDIKANMALETVNRLTAGEIVGSLRTNQVAQSLKQFGANAFNANVSLSESVALVEALAKQRPAENVGIDARNLLIVMDSAKALDKKAKQSLRKSGVDLGFLMDKTHSLSERLHELQKVEKDAVGMARVFGERNVTAAHVIFQQLGTYDAYVEKIRVTNEAQNQAATNSKTLGVAIDQLKNTWVNFITTSDTSAKVLQNAAGAMNFLSDNMETIVSMGLRVAGAFLLWKGAIMVTNIAMITYEVTLGIYNALFTRSVVLTKGGALAQATYIGVTKAAIIVMDVLNGEFATLNALMMANPAGLIIAGLVALGATIWYVSKRNEELREEYQKKIDLQIDKSVGVEAEEVKKLAWHYWQLGDNMDRATAKAIKFKKNALDLERAELEATIARTKKSVAKDNQDKFGMFGMLGVYGQGRGANADSLEAQQGRALALSLKNVDLTKFAEGKVNSGVVNKKDLGGAFNAPKSDPALSAFSFNAQDNPFKKADSPQPVTPLKTSIPFSSIDYDKMADAFAKKEQKITIELKNAPPGTTVKTNGAGVATQNSY